MRWGFRWDSSYHTNQFTKFATLSGQRKTRALSMFYGAPPPSLREERALIRFPNVDPFSKHSQRFTRLLPEVVFSTLAIKAELPLLAPKPACSPGLGRALASTSVPQPQGEQAAVPPRQECWHWPRRGMRGWKDSPLLLCTPNPQPNFGPSSKKQTGRKLGVG